MNGKPEIAFVRAVSHLGLSLAFLAMGCQEQLEADAQAHAGDARPKVTVALPLVAQITEFSEHTGRTEAPSTVHVHTRATGHLTSAAFREGDLVKKGDLLFVIDPRPYQAVLARAKAEFESVRVDHQLATREATRADQLFKANVLAEQERDVRDAALHQLAARADVAQAAVASAELDLGYAFVRAPIDGRIGRMLITPGNLVGPATPSPLATVVSVDPLYIYMDVEETRALRLRRGEGAVARCGFPGEAGYPHEAAIDFLDNRVNPETGMLKVRAVLKNPDGAWLPGLFARVRLPEREAHQRLLIADVAVGTDQNQRFVWVVAADRKAQRRKVELGPLDHGLRVVRQGLTASDRVVVRGLQRVQPGLELVAELAPMREAARIDKGAP